MKIFTTIPIAILACITLLGGLTQLRAQTSAFTYQGRLSDNGGAANGAYDLQITLFNAATLGSVQGSPVTQVPVNVSNGLFTVTLDFGSSVFDGNARWLEIGVRTNGSVAAYTLLSPRQALTAAPYATRAANAASANSVAAANITGTLDEARLSANVALLNRSVQTFTGGTNSFSGRVGIGTASPQTALEIKDASVTGPSLRLTGVGGNGAKVGIDLATYNPVSLGETNPGVRIEAVDNNYSANLDFQTKVPGVPGNALTSRLFIQNDGKIGIGTNNPVSTLHVVGTVTATTFTGNGAGLTNLSGSQLTGTIPLAQLPASLVTNGASGVNITGTFSGNGAGVTNVSISTLNTYGGITWRGNFVINSSPAVGTNPRSVAAVDVNGDGRLDLISANYVANTLTVLTNNGSGGFVTASPPAVGSNPYSVTPADVNGDGKVDLVSANWGANTLTVLTNNGSGGFLTASSPAVGSQPYSVAAVDVSGDGKADLISANNGSSTLTVLFSTPTFSGDGSGLLNAAGWTRAGANIHYSLGNVGIGTATPGYTLEVNGSAHRVDNSANWTVASDRRYKRDITPLTNSLAVLEQLRPSRFRYNEDYVREHPATTDNERVGFVAQEFEQVFPDYVTRNADGYLSVDISPVTFHNTEAIRELNQKLEAQKEENADLKARLKRLEQFIESQKK